MEALSKPMATLSHDIFPRVLPEIHSDLNLYGKNYLSWAGNMAKLFITEPELVKEVLKNSERIFPKRTSRERKRNQDNIFDKIIGDGVFSSEGEKWAKQRKLANHAFHGENLKNMTPAMIASVETMLDKWKQFEGKEIEVFQELKLLTSEVISRTAFGSSYLEGEKIFDMLTRLAVLASRNPSQTKIPVISELWKTGDSIESDKLVKGIHDCVMEMVKKREEKVFSGEANSFGTDFLGSLINAFHDPDKNNRLSEQELVDNCKTFYFGGHETSTAALAWTVLLLAIHQDWQEKARKEVFEVFGNQNPHSEGIARLKTMTMIINETLRLYPPASALPRRVENEVQLGNLTLPTDLLVMIPVIALHHDPKTWGDDVHLFKPERFAQGIAKATNYNASTYIPFGFGPRVCVGMSFSLTEIKIALSMILQRYTISLSPSYIHAPCIRLTIQPQHGIQIFLLAKQSSWSVLRKLKKLVDKEGFISKAINKGKQVVKEAAPKGNKPILNMGQAINALKKGEFVFQAEASTSGPKVGSSSKKATQTREIMENEVFLGGGNLELQDDVTPLEIGVAVVEHGAQGSTSQATTLVQEKQDDSMQVDAEIKADVKVVEEMSKTLKFSNFFDVPSQGMSGGIALFWNDSSLKLDILVNTIMKFRGRWDACDLLDAGSSGCRFTWIKRVGGRIILQEKLDRVLWNVAALSKNPFAKVVVVRKFLN
ncbi:Cytochrome P450 [Corchorus capsularis]|uniref:Cytochrome P450 n=1 Tax=Corchorus capsularis TaxID=210143 RepID=A0A1R3IE44_COCAP|nr:Cytochrome P450 [Corchorus capsularis]